MKSLIVSFETLAIALIFFSFPLGFRTKELTYCGLLGVLILLLNNSIKVSNIKFTLIFLVIALLGTFFSIINYQEFSIFQFFRGLVFPILIIFLLDAKIKPTFFIRLEKLIPIIVIGALASAFFYFFVKSEIYNSTLDIPYKFSEYKRLYIYPFYFFFILFFDAINKNNNIHVVYALLLILSGSKLILLLTILIYCYKYLNKNLFSNNPLYFIGIFFILIYLAFSLRIPERFSDLYQYGDPWKMQEPLNAFKRLLHPVRFFIGNGAGIPYSEGEADHSIFLSNYRLVENSRFDIHNGIATLCLRFGVPLGIFFLYKLYKPVLTIPNKNFLFFLLFLLIFFSHGPIQTAEALGLAFGIRLLSFKNNSSITGK